MSDEAKPQANAVTTNCSTAITRKNAHAASNDWGFNCGPGALCGVLGLSPGEVRPHLGDFESKGYVNPTMMASALRSIGVPFRRVFESPIAPTKKIVYPTFGFVRIQWDGPWTKEGVPMAARYRATHWIGYRQNADPIVDEVFDVNAVVAGGWLSCGEWANELVPWLLRRAVPKASGKWWPTHCWEVTK